MAPSYSPCGIVPHVDLTDTNTTMPRKPDQLREQIRALEALVKADKAERRATEAPLRVARRKLAASLAWALKSLDRANTRLSEIIYDAELQLAGSLGVWRFKTEPAERAIEAATATFKSRLADLMTFDVANNIEADYPQLPVLDKQATIAAAHADRKRAVEDIRARYERPQRPAVPPSSQLFSPMSSPDEVNT